VFDEMGYSAQMGRLLLRAVSDKEVDAGERKTAFRFFIDEPEPVVVDVGFDGHFTI